MTGRKGGQAVVTTGGEGAAPACRPFRHRHDGWTRARQEGFLARLAETGCVRSGCEAVGLSSTSAYRAYARMPDFAAAWDRALAARKPMLEDAAFERAVHGVAVPLTRLGQVVGEGRRYSDGLLRYLIERSDRRAAAEGAARAAAEVAEKATPAREQAGGRDLARAASPYPPGWNEARVSEAMRTLWPECASLSELDERLEAMVWADS